MATTSPGLGQLSLNDQTVEINTSSGNQLSAATIGALGNSLGGFFSNQFIDSPDVGRVFGTLMSSTTDTLTNNLLKGSALTQDLGKNTGSALIGSGVGIGANYLGQAISNSMNNSKLGRALGAGTATTLGSVGGTALSNLVKFGSIAGKADKLFGTMDYASKMAKAAELVNAGKAANLAEASKVVGKAGVINPYALGATVLGSALGAANGPSKEYGGKYGTGVQIADMAYDVTAAAANAIPVAGQMISGMMTLNKGLSNLFGSTSGMTLQDAILGSAWMPAPVKWINMINAKTTGAFNNQSWQNTERTNSFMGNAFGDLADRFDKARQEAGKTYGTFSQRAYRKAQNNLDFSNSAWGKILAMTDQNELQNIRSQLMTSINNQRYAQNIQGGWSPLTRGKFGMKIFNNATNHDLGMRLLSGAALIDSKQMILCSVVD